MLQIDSGAQIGILSCTGAVERFRLESAMRPKEAASASIKVLVRCRPLVTGENEDQINLLRVEPASGTCEVLPDDDTEGMEAQSAHRAHRKASHRPIKTGLASKYFKFDSALDGSASQADVYTQGGIDAMVDAVLSGFHATVFAYGQTGSGKTHTMEGYRYVTSSGEPIADIRGTEEERLGIIPRAVAALFDQAKKRSNSSQGYQISCHHLQIYKEEVYDLLGRAAKVATGGKGSLSSSSRTKGLRMRWNSVRGFYMDGLEVAACETAEDALVQFQRGIRNKILSSHRMNLSSSRSHSVFTLQVEAISDLGTNSSRSTLSTFSLVDLAGSERSSLTGTTGRALQESIYINKSLFTLRKVISALCIPKYRHSGVHVPFRDSKLTSLLQHSLGGTSVTLMIACVNPSNRHRDENLSTLEYAARTKRIVNVIFVNEDSRSSAIRQLREENSALRARIVELKGLLAAATSGSSAEFRMEPACTPVEAGVFPLQNSDVVESAHEVLYSDSAISNDSTLEEVRSRNRAMSAKILQSMRIIKDLLERNERSIREREEHDAAAKEIIYARDEAMIENAELRERIDILESVLLLDGEEVARLEENGMASLGGREGILTADKAIVLELLELRKENALLTEKLSVWEDTEGDRRNSGASTTRRTSQALSASANRPQSSPYENRKSKGQGKAPRGPSRVPADAYRGRSELRTASTRKKLTKTSESPFPVRLDTDYNFGTFKEALDTAQQIQAQRATGTLPFTLGDIPTIFPSGRVSTTGGRLGNPASSSRAAKTQSTGHGFGFDNEKASKSPQPRTSLYRNSDPKSDGEDENGEDSEISRLLRQLRKSMRLGTA